MINTFQLFDVTNEEYNLKNLPGELKGIIEEKFKTNPTLVEIAQMFYKYEIYGGIDYIHREYKNKIENDYYAEIIFTYLCKLGDKARIQYFYEKYKNYLEARGNFDKYQFYDENQIVDIKNYDDYCYEPLFDYGLSILCKKKKVEILKYLYGIGFSPSMRQLKKAARSENEETLFVILDNMNKGLIANYIPLLIEEMVCYTKISPIAFLLENIDLNSIEKEQLDRAIENCVSVTAKKSKLEMFKYLLDKGCDFRANNYKSLEYIFGYGHLDILDFLYSEMDLENDENWDLRKMISLAIEYNKLDIIKYMVENKKYKNSKYNLLEDIQLIVDKCKEYRKRSDTLNYLIKEVFKFDDNLISILKDSYPKQKMLMSFLINH